MPPNSAAEFQAPFFVGIDVGGTNFKIGVVDDAGRTICSGNFPTQPDKPPPVGFETTRQKLDELFVKNSLRWSDIAAVGLGTPGPMDIGAGMILTPVNLPGWHQHAIRDELASVLEMPVMLANDAGAAAYGEFWVGSGRQLDSLVLITLGTGIGGGIIVGDLSIDGFHSHGAEVGHMAIETGPQARKCRCGQFGHLEAYASATSLVERTREAISSKTEASTKSLLNETIGDHSPLSALMISEAASAGDALATKMVDETARYLGVGIAALAHVIDPEAFILGGAMNFGGSSTPLGQKFLADVMAATRKLVFPVLAEKLIVDFATLGGSAGYIGAAGLARQQYLKKKKI